MNDLEKKQQRNIFANRLRMIREQKGLNQHQVAQAMDLSQSIISKHEAALTDLSLEMVIRYAAVYGCSIDYLWGMGTVNDGTVRAKMLAAFEQLTTAQQEFYAVILEGFVACKK